MILKPIQSCQQFSNNCIMGCVSSIVETTTRTQSTGIRSYGFLSQKVIQKGHSFNIGQKQNLSLSDCDAFLQQSKKEGRTDYPSVFKLIKITPVSDQVLNKTPKQDICALSCTRIQLINLAVEMVMENNFAKASLNTDNLTLLVAEIADNYHSVSYHNFTHGFSLAQMLYKCFKADPKLGAVYSDEDLTYYMIAGMAHDINHKGTNNSYEEKMKTELAKTAENTAVLEKMHLKTFLQITRRKPEFDIISKSNNPQSTKEKITRAILATDVSKHFAKVQHLEETRKEGKLDFQNEQTKIMFMENLFHACDIGNSLLPTEQFMNWSALLTYQFHEQTKLQAANNVPVSEFLKYKGFNSFCDGQAGFLEKFVVPIWKQITVSFSGINKLYQNCHKNIAAIKALKQKQND